eukprot:2160049-Amphidinium_carterae.2
MFPPSGQRQVRSVEDGGAVEIQGFLESSSSCTMNAREAEVHEPLVAASKMFKATQSVKLHVESGVYNFYIQNAKHPWHRLRCCKSLGAISTGFSSDDAGVCSRTNALMQWTMLGIRSTTERLSETQSGGGLSTVAKTTSAPGPDSWRTVELCALPDCALSQLAALFNSFETCEVWPALLATSWLSRYVCKLLTPPCCCGLHKGFPFRSRESRQARFFSKLACWIHGALLAQTRRVLLVHMEVQRPHHEWAHLRVRKWDSPRVFPLSTGFPNDATSCGHSVAPFVSVHLCVCAGDITIWSGNTSDLAAAPMELLTY